MQLLVVEDDDIVRMLIVEVLGDLGYTAIEADSAAAALEVLEDSNQDLALLMTDVGLPDMRGEDLAAKPVNCAQCCRCCLPAVMPKR